MRLRSTGRKTQDSRARTFQFTIFPWCLHCVNAETQNIQQVQNHLLQGLHTTLSTSYSNFIHGCQVEAMTKRAFCRSMIDLSGTSIPPVCNKHIILVNAATGGDMALLYRSHMYQTSCKMCVAQVAEMNRTCWSETRGYLEPFIRFPENVMPEQQAEVGETFGQCRKGFPSMFRRCRVAIAVLMWNVR